VRHEQPRPFRQPVGAAAAAPRLRLRPADRRGKHRVCEHAAAGSLFTLADYPPDRPVHPQPHYGVRLEQDNFGLLSRDEFDRWVDRRTKVNATKLNGSGGTRKSPKGVPGKSP
jgi:hypothetical protein